MGHNKAQRGLTGLDGARRGATRREGAWQGAKGLDKARRGATGRNRAQWGATGRDRAWKKSIVHGSLFLMNCDKQNQKFDQLHSVWIYKKHCKMSTSPCFLFFQVFQLVLFLNCFLLVLRKSDSKKKGNDSLIIKRWLWNWSLISIIVLNPFLHHLHKNLSQKWLKSSWLSWKCFFIADSQLVGVS